MPGIVHFEVPADDLERARVFYGSLFGWRIDEIPGMEGMDYMFIDPFAAPGGGVMKRQRKEHQITVYFGVPSVDEYSKKVESLGGKIAVPKMAVPGMGYFAICLDTENNAFGIWEMESKAKQ